MQIHAIIVAGGMGSRMQADLPKQFMLLHNKPMLLHSIDVMQAVQAHIIVVVHPQFETYLQDLLIEFNYKNIQIVQGGITRFDSVKNGVHAIQANATDVVLVHDAARPFITKEMVEQIIAKVQNNNCVVPVTPIFDSLRMVANGQSKIINRDTIKIIQTPQAAMLSTLQQGFAQSYTEAFTDEASVCEAAGFEVSLVDGLQQNIKITTAQQLQMANAMG